MQRDAPAFTDDDLRYRQLAMRQRPATEAVVFFAMDVSSSMTDRDRRLAKTFFFWVVQGLRRQYTHIEPVFVAHTIEAWEFAENGVLPGERFRRHRGVVGVPQDPRDLPRERYDPCRFNIYVFYASDGANFRHDRETAQTALDELGKIANFIGYVETALDGAAGAQHRDIRRCSSSSRPKRASRGATDCRRPSRSGTRFARSSASRPTAEV